MAKLNRIISALFYRFNRIIIGPDAQISYSQEGEDMILRRIFDGRRSGFYVDVGAHHPKRFSNTHHFYRRGWKGINIEPNPDMRPAFMAIRKRDINLQIGVAETRGKLAYYSFDEPALNTFDRSIVEQRLSSTHYKVVSKTDVPVMRLDELLSQYLPPDTSIDFLTIDVEGLDYSVLRSNNWQTFRPRVVLVEDLERSLEDAMTSELFVFMKSLGYRLVAKTFNTLFFEDRADG